MFIRAVKSISPFRRHIIAGADYGMFSLFSGVSVMNCSNDPNSFCNITIVAMALIKVFDIEGC